jgi:ADP-ribose pyrophosphatase YjhB (NUDIX family)
MKYISIKQYDAIKDIPRGRLAARYLLYAGAIIEDKNKILLVQSSRSKYSGWQFPGGRVLWSESIIECLKREVLEETSLSIEINSFIGIFQRNTTPEDEEYLRFIFSVKDFKHKKNVLKDPGISKAEWFDIQSILDGKVPLQSKQMLVEIKRYTQNQTYPLEVLDTYTW